MKPDVKNYKIICTKCKGVSRLAILDNKTVIYKDHLPIISARFRPDMNWGFECQCGNDSRVAAEEKENLKFLVQGGSKEVIQRIADNLMPKSENKFIMETV